MLPFLRLRTVAAVLSCVFTLAAAGQQPAPDLRIWTATNGQTFKARLIGVEGGSGVFQLEDGRTTKVGLLYLSAADRTLISTGMKPAAPQPVAPPVVKPAPASPVGSPGKQPVWPAIVEVPPSSIEITVVEENPANKNCVYKSQSFQFVSQEKLAGSVMKEVARTFEATRSLVNALPWSIDPKPPSDIGFYQAKLYTTREAYMADGGPANSGGVYFSKDRIFRIPFPSLGLELRGKTWFKRQDYRGDTIIHEVTHQLMHDFLPFLPSWIIEGTAEYTESLPYNAGRFIAGSHARGVKEYVQESTSRRSLTTEFRPFDAHMKMNRSTWGSLSMDSHSQHLLYYQSYILVYYFSHLDGDGKGTRFIKYFEAIAEARKSWADFFKNPAVTVHPDGSYTFPGGLPMPAAKRSEEFGIEKMSILLDGRDAATLEADIKAGFKKIGIKL